MDLVYLILGLAILVGAGDALVRGAVGLSLQFGIPPFIISATVVAFGTSAPELLISIEAAREGAAGRSVRHGPAKRGVGDASGHQREWWPRRRSRSERVRGGHRERVGGPVRQTLDRA